MKTQNLLRWSLPAGFLLAVAALALAAWSYGYRQALDSLAERSAADLALASDRVSTQLQVYQELAVLTAEHPALADLSTPERRPGRRTCCGRWRTRPRRWMCSLPRRTGRCWRRPKG
ncbi:C4-dicarboxylate transport sensor protein [Rhodobacterales bacterium Y4I]|nr:C4-dicarboxylate transport sensor protein [Rhodobacterales bacterium Y4I]